MSRRKRLTFWGADENDDSLARSVMEGRKTVTADTVEAYYQGYGEYGDGSYAPGDLIEVYDLKQRLRCIIRATRVYTIKFGDVPEEVWRGETFCSAEEFRQCHIECLPHLDLHDRFEFVTLHFELVEVIARDFAEGARNGTSQGDEVAGPRSSDAHEGNRLSSRASTSTRPPR